MNRFEYSNAFLKENETILVKEINVRLYDGDQKTDFEGGEIIITSHRLIWGYPGNFNAGQNVLSLPLQHISHLQEESPSTFSFSRSKKIVLQLKEPSLDKERPQLSSCHNSIKLSFKNGFSTDIISIINDSIQNIKLEDRNGNVEKQRSNVKLRTGIVGIERSLQEKQKATDSSISLAFQDLDKLMNMAKEMVQISNNISTKIKERQGDITEDETVRFKSYLLSLGIDNPVTRDSYKSDNQYYQNLAKQICEILLEPLTEIDGMMSLTDVYCRVNRARGLELLSPQDILNSCLVMSRLGLPLKLFQFDSGVKVLQLKTLNNENISDATHAVIEEKGSLTAEEFAQLLNISVLFARQRLLITENIGKCCRDDSIEGLRFYPNLFLSRMD